MAAALALTACGVAQGSAANSTAQAQHKATAGALPMLTTAQAHARHLSGVPWRLVRMEAGGRVAVVGFTAGGCRPKPVGVMLASSAKSVTVSLMAPRVRAGSMCEPTLLAGTAKVALPALAGRQLLHAPVAVVPQGAHSGTSG